MSNFVSRLFGRRALIAVSLLAIVALLAVGVFNIQVKGPGGDNGGLLSVSAGQRTLVIGAVDSVAAAGTVDYTCDGVADNVQFQAALNALPAGGGRISVLAGTYVFAAGTSVTRAIDNVTIVGVGRGTYFTGDGVTAIFVAGGNNWKFEDLRTDAGGITLGATTGWQMTNVLINATYYAYRTANNSELGTITTSGKLTAGANEVEGSNFDIDGGDISNITMSGTWLGTAITLPHLGISTPSSASVGIKVADTYTITDNGTYQGANITNTALKTAAAFTGVASNIIQTYVGAANNQNWTHANYGLIGLAAHTKTEIGSTGTITWAQDFQTFGEYSGATATNHANFYGVAPTGNIGTAYMIYLDTPTAGATANYGVYSTGGLNYFGGHVGIGLAPTTDRALNLQDIYTIADDNPRSGAILQAQGSKTSAAFASTVQGVSAQGAVAAANTQDWTAARGLKTLVGQSYILDGAAGTITGVADITAAFYTGASTTTNRYGLYVEDATGAGTLTNQYGIYFESLTKGGTLNYMLHGAADITVGMGINIATGKTYQVAGTQVVGARVVDARSDDVINSGDATTDGVIDALRDAMIAHGLIAAS